MIIPVAVAEPFVDPDHPGERPRERHGEDDPARHTHPPVLGRRRVLPDGAHLITPLRPPEEDPDQRADDVPPIGPESVDEPT